MALQARRTRCGLEIPQTQVLRLMDEPDAHLVGTFRVEGPEGRPVSSATIIRPTETVWQTSRQIVEAELDWLAYHDEHCDICREDS